MLVQSHLSQIHIDNILNKCSNPTMDHLQIYFQITVIDIIEVGMKKIIKNKFKLYIMNITNYLGFEYK